MATNLEPIAKKKIMVKKGRYAINIYSFSSNRSHYIPKKDYTEESPDRPRRGGGRGRGRGRGKGRVSNQQEIIEEK